MGCAVPRPDPQTGASRQNKQACPRKEEESRPPSPLRAARSGLLSVPGRLFYLVPYFYHHQRIHHPQGVMQYVRTKTLYADSRFSAFTSKINVLTFLNRRCPAQITKKNKVVNRTGNRKYIKQTRVEGRRTFLSSSSLVPSLFYYFRGQSMLPTRSPLKDKQIFFFLRALVFATDSGCAASKIACVLLLLRITVYRIPMHYTSIKPSPRA